MDKDFITEEIARYTHNEKARKNIKKFIDTGKMTDENGNKIDLGKTVNYKMKDILDMDKDALNENLEYTNELAIRVNLLSDALIALNARLRIIEEMILNDH